jgi:hypothetical protein
VRGDSLGDSFQGGPKWPCPPAAHRPEGPPERAITLRKKERSAWRKCRPGRETLAGLNARWGAADDVSCPGRNRVGERSGRRIDGAFAEHGRCPQMPTAVAVMLARGAGRSGLHQARGAKFRIECEVASMGGRFPEAGCPQLLPAVHFFAVLCLSSRIRLPSDLAARRGGHARNVDTLSRVEALPHSRYARGVELGAGSASIRSTTASGTIRDHH